MHDILKQIEQEFYAGFPDNTNSIHRIVGQYDLGPVKTNIIVKYLWDTKRLYEKTLQYQGPNLGLTVVASSAAGALAGHVLEEAISNRKPSGLGVLAGILTGAFLESTLQPLRSTAKEVTKEAGQEMFKEQTSVLRKRTLEALTQE